VKRSFPIIEGWTIQFIKAREAMEWKIAKEFGLNTLIVIP